MTQVTTEFTNSSVERGSTLVDESRNVGSALQVITV